MGPNLHTSYTTKFRSNLVLLRDMDIFRVSILSGSLAKEKHFMKKIIITLFSYSSNDLNIAEEKMLQHFSSYPYVKQYSDEYYPASDENPTGNENYIYVTYPPEIKRKLLDRYGEKEEKHYLICNTKQHVGSNLLSLISAVIIELLDCKKRSGEYNGKLPFSLVSHTRTNFGIKQNTNKT